MTLINDVDLLILDPAVFVDATSAATRLLTATDGAISGATLTSAGSDFASAGVDEGSVAVVAGEALEVTGRISATSLGVSRPRPRESAAPIPPAAGSGLELSVWTFSRAIELAQSWVLGALGIDAHDPALPLDETAILNAPAVARLIALRTLHQAYTLAAAAEPDENALSDKSTHYARLFESARQQTLAVLDTNGDGVADATRRVAVVQFTRA